MRGTRAIEQPIQLLIREDRQEAGEAGLSQVRDAVDRALIQEAQDGCEELLAVLLPAG
jgi:hypothetical protein